jgi:maltose 6'-phosphate phosphatase
LKLATYNIWNSRERWDVRLPQLKSVLESLEADVVAVQEAPKGVAAGVSFEEYFTSGIYPYVRHFAYPIVDEGERPEGLAFLCKTDFIESQVNWAANQDTSNSWAASVLVYADALQARITNVHLDYRSASNRNAAIVKIVRDLAEPADLGLDILCGDFNGHPNSDVDLFLRGAAQLEGHKTQWSDMAELAPERDAAESPTLDFINNLRWTTKTVNEKPGRFDRIYVRPADAHIHVAHCAVFGSGRNAPSDHYGVVVEVTPTSPQFGQAPP